MTRIRISIISQGKISWPTRISSIVACRALGVVGQGVAVLAEDGVEVAGFERDELALGPGRVDAEAERRLRGRRRPGRHRPLADQLGGDDQRATSLVAGGVSRFGRLLVGPR